MRKTALVRIDDAGKHDPLTERLLVDLCEADVRVSCGVVPMWLDERFKDFVIKLAESDTGGRNLEIHQHGYSHANYGSLDNEHEFGFGRSLSAQRREITTGRRILEQAFGSLFFSAFSPPYGGYDDSVRNILRDLGFAVVSGVDGGYRNHIILEFSAGIDCFHWHPTRERPWEEIAAEWEAKSSLNFRGIVLHPWLMSPTSATRLSQELPMLLSEVRVMTFAELAVHSSAIFEGLFLDSRAVQGADAEG